MPGRAATIVSSPSCRPLVSRSYRSKPVGVPVICEPRELALSMRLKASRITSRRAKTVLDSCVRAMS